MEKILKTIKQTDHDLDLKFEGIWSELIGHFHSPTMKEEVCIADATEEALKHPSGHAQLTDLHSFV